jgi:hypothetical protein
MGDALRNAGLQGSMIHYQLYNQGLAGQTLAGQLAGVNQQSHADSVSTTESSPSPFQSILGALGTGMSMLGGGGLGGLFGGLSTSVMPGTAANGGWSTTVKPAGIFGFEGGGAVKKADGGGIDLDGDGIPDVHMDKMLSRVTKAAKALQEFRKASGGGVKGYEGGGEAGDGFYDEPPINAGRFANLDIAPLGPREPLGPPASLAAKEEPVLKPAIAYSVPPAVTLPEGWGPPAAAPAAVAGDLNKRVTTAGGSEYRDYERPELPPPVAPYKGAELPGYSRPSTPYARPDYLNDRMGDVWRGGGGTPMQRMGMALANISPLTSGFSKAMGDLTNDRYKNIDALRQDEKDYADATGIFRNMDTLKKQSLAQEAAKAAADERYREHQSARQARLDDVNIGSTQVNTDLNAEKLDRLKNPGKVYDEREALADRLVALGAMKPNSPEYAEFIATGDFPKAGKTPESAFDTAAAQSSNKDREGRNAAIEASRTKIDRLNQMEQLASNPNVYQGAGADLALSAKKWLLAAGVKNAEGIPETEALNALGNQLALSLRNPAGGEGMPGAMSDADRKFLQSSTPGALSNTRPGNLLLIRLTREQEEWKQRYEQAAANYIATKKSNVGLNEYLGSWIQANPRFAPETVAAADAEAGKVIETKRAKAAETARLQGIPMLTGQQYQEAIASGALKPGDRFMTEDGDTRTVSGMPKVAPMVSPRQIYGN